MKDYMQMRLTPTEKLKHELLGSLGVIKMLSDAMVKSSDLVRKNEFGKLINSLASRNMVIIASFEASIVP